MVVVTDFATLMVSSYAKNGASSAMFLPFPVEFPRLAMEVTAMVRFEVLLRFRAAFTISVWSLRLLQQ